MANEFLNVVNDKFTNKTTTRMSYGYNVWQCSDWQRNDPTYCNSFIHSRDCPMQMRLRHVSTPNIDSLVLDLDYTFIRDWVFLRDGELIININNVENIRLKAHENYSDVDSGPGPVTVSESVYYDLNNELLKKICDAKTLGFKIVAKHEVFEVNENGFINYAQVFYNGFYDSTQYVESLEIPRSYLRDKEKQEKNEKKTAIGCYIVLLIIVVAVVLFFCHKLKLL